MTSSSQYVPSFVVDARIALKGFISFGKRAQVLDSEQQTLRQSLLTASK